MFPQEAAEEVLRFENVTVRFEDEVTALNDVSFAVTAGESRILLGAAGSGKTVLLKASIGLVRPSEGRVYLFGTDITDLPEDDLIDLRAKVGVLFQEGGLFDSLTVEENVAYPLLNQRRVRYPPEEVRRRVIEALRFVELEETLDKYPAELSGGMRRRVGIARANVTEPPLVLYDSPTAGLDPITATTIMTLILKERDTKNTTTVMATHRYQDGYLLANYRYNPATGRMEKAGSAGAVGVKTRYLVLREGKIVFEGTQAEIEACDDPYVRKFVKRLNS